MNVSSKTVCATRKLSALSPCVTRLMHELQSDANNVRILLLEGSLGSGKTTFVGALAHVLGIQDEVDSPTFVLMQEYPLKNSSWERFIHIDCYRLLEAERANVVQDMEARGILETLHDSDAFVVVEWGEVLKEYCMQHRLAFHVLRFAVIEDTYTIVLSS